MPRRERTCCMYKKNSLKNIMVCSFVIIVVLLVGIIGFMMLSGWKNSLDAFIADMENETTREIIDEVEAFVHIPLALNKLNHNIIQRGIVDIYNKKQRESYFVSILKETPDEVYSFSFGTERGEYYGARRNERNEIEIMQSDAWTNGHSRYFTVTDSLNAGELVKDFGVFDPTIRDWYQAAKDKKTATFSPIYRHFVVNDLAISASYPIYDAQGILKGVLGSHLILSKINENLNRIVVNKKITAYIIEKDSGQLVANSRGIPNFKTLPNNEIGGITIDDIGNHHISEAYRNYKTNSIDHYIVTTELDRFHIKLTEYNKEGLNWLIITAIPESEFTGPISSTIKNIVLLTICLLIVSVLLWIKMADHLLQPIYALKEATERFSAGDLSHRALIIRNDEIGELSAAFNKMATDLHSLIGKLSKSFNMNPNIIMLVSLQDNTYIDVNDAFLKSTGLLREEVIGHSNNDLHLWLDLEDRIKARKLFNSLGFLSNYEIKYRTKSGVQNGLLSYEKNEINGQPCLLIVITDITAKKHLDAELARLDSLNLIGEMAASIGHEVRNPMTTVRGYLQVFQRNQIFSSYSEQLTTMIEELDRANEIITEFLHLAKNKKAEFKLLNLNDIVNVLLPLIQADALRIGHMIEVEKSDIPCVLLDNKEIRQVILNLVRNAMESMQSPGTVTIKTYYINNNVTLEVSDTGTGIPPEIANKIGTPFLTTKENGTGLGLAVCYRIAERHNAKLEFRTGQLGTSFYLKFSSKDAEPREHPPSETKSRA